MSEPTLGKTPTLAIETIARDLAAAAGMTPPDLSIWHLAAACVALDFLPRYAAERMVADLVAGKTTIASVDRSLRGHLIAGISRMQAELRSLRASAQASGGHKPPDSVAVAGGHMPKVLIAGADGHQPDADQPVTFSAVRQIARNTAVEMVQRHLAASLDVGGRRRIPAANQSKGEKP